jgi:hypothetical protein
MSTITGKRLSWSYCNEKANDTTVTNGFFTPHLGLLLFNIKPYIIVMVDSQLNNTSIINRETCVTPH